MSSPPPPRWYWADVGFDTTKKLWFVNLFDYKGVVQWYVAKNIILRNGFGVQYQWPDSGQRQFWHVRERIYVRDVRNISYDEAGNLVVDSVRMEGPEEVSPPDFSYLVYAYSLKTSRGFVEFFDANNQSLGRINDKWILVENLNRKTIGEYPNIRLRVEKSEIRKIIVTKSAFIIQG